MTDSPSHVGAPRSAKPDRDRMAGVLAAAFVGHAVASVDIVLIVWLFSHQPPHAMWEPYLVLASMGLVLLPGIYWMRFTGQPRTRAIRAVMSIGLYVEAVGIGLGFAVVRLRIIPRTDILEAAPFVLSLLAACMALTYPMVRRMLERDRQ